MQYLKTYLNKIIARGNEKLAESSIEFNSVKIVHTMRTDNTIPISVISVRPLFFRKLLVASLIQTPIVIPPRAYRP